MTRFGWMLTIFAVGLWLAMAHVLRTYDSGDPWGRAVIGGIFLLFLFDLYLALLTGPPIKMKDGSYMKFLPVEVRFLRWLSSKGLN